MTVITPNQLNFLKLRKYDLDLFKQTAKATDRDEFVIDGFLTLEEVEMLVQGGYQVTIKGDPTKENTGRSEAIGFQDWINGVNKRMGKSVDSSKLAESSDASNRDSGYLTSEGIESAIQHLPKEYPSICKILVLDEHSHEGRTSRAIKISGDSANNTKNGVLFIGGVHAREIVNPDLLVKLAYDLCEAYDSSSKLVFGKKTFDVSDVKKIINDLNVFILPLVNPDGRVIVQSDPGDPTWRKNRKRNSCTSRFGVDINRNYDFLWNSGIGTSSNDCSDIFRGTEAFSEPETRNVLRLIDNYSNIKCMIDVHSFSEDILYPWGDDNNQTLDSYMNFMNREYDGLRGNLGDSEYQEYIPQSDLEWFQETGNKIKVSIKSVRGTDYAVKQSIGLYPTSGCSHDYFYSRHFVKSTERKILAYTIETGKQQPGQNPFAIPFSQAEEIIPEVSAGLIEFCLASISIKNEIGVATKKLQ